MKDLFADFRPEAYEHRDAVENIADAKKSAMEELVGGYVDLMREEVKNLAWLVDHETVARAYDQSAANTSRPVLHPGGYRTVLRRNGPRLADRHGRPGPAGLYLSALVNYSRENSIILRLPTINRIVPFYRLRAAAREDTDH